MPKRGDLKTILLLGAGPIVIGQACEFDYSGAQACKALRAEGYRIVLVNSNPATIMTDPDMADATYIEPLAWTALEPIIAKERPDAILPTMGGQTALNCALDLAYHGILEKYAVEMIGASKTAIEKAENREKFRDAMHQIGLAVPKSGIAHSLDQALAIIEDVGYPAIIRPSYTLGGAGGGIAYNREELVQICTQGFDLSPTHELLIDQSILGWKEYEMEVIRDRLDQCIIICSIENIDPMGIHTGDSITVAPAQTLTDKEYQNLRNAAIAVLREIGVDTGGSNVQFAINPANGEVMVIEMNPRVSRSSALASKATGFPIAKVAALLAVGYTLDELSNEITGGKTPISFEPSIDYVAVKIPRFNFEKFPNTNATLTTQMKSVGEVMAIGRDFQAALQKAIRGLEVDFCGFESRLDSADPEPEQTIKRELSQPSWDRLWYVADAMRHGFRLDEIHNITRIDPWFLEQIAGIIACEAEVKSLSLEQINARNMRLLKRRGFADARIAQLLGINEKQVRQHRLSLNIRPSFKRVDSCAAEFPTDTAYLYSCYETDCEAIPSDAKKIIILGGGPNRIGQGIEFDYCCVHAALALRDAGYQTIMINCNPETVSTDFDCSDRLYFESLTLEDVLAIVDLEQPEGLVIHYGGQTPLKLASALAEEGVPIIGTSPDSIDRAEDRERFQGVLHKLQLKQPLNGTVRSIEEGLRLANVLAYPLMARPSYVLGGRAMEVVHNQDEFLRYLNRLTLISPDAPLLLDQYLDHAIEVDVDAICDGEQVLVAGILEHIEQAGIHSGDSACCLPAHQLSIEWQNRITMQMEKLAIELGVVGLMNAQFAIQDDEIYVLEVNPRASRTVPFVSKVIGLPLAKIAARCMVGQRLAEQGVSTKRPEPPYFAVKHPVFPFDRFSGVDPALGPEMRSTGEVMGIGQSFGEAFAKAQLGTGLSLPTQGQVFISVRDADKAAVIPIAQQLVAQGFTLVATQGTQLALNQANVACAHINKYTEGRPNIVDLVKNDAIQFIINTTEGKQALADSMIIRRTAVQHKLCYTTTIAGAKAMCLALTSPKSEQVNSIQDRYQQLSQPATNSIRADHFRTAT